MKFSESQIGELRPFSATWSRMVVTAFVRQHSIPIDETTQRDLVLFLAKTVDDLFNAVDDTIAGMKKEALASLDYVPEIVRPATEELLSGHYDIIRRYIPAVIKMEWSDSEGDVPTEALT